ncbi:DEAD/DEAH box helicase family protein [Caproiciproducens sp. NJN-50]|uniref:DEAD/DEAH box helicase family protein n=1 Tax=Caproiciproducens sp. NJN-50 TaxID=2507162 RepID=UPI00196AB657|nr:DEAD/DEAH box helicase family protein [Caproiciproducens sp. NJN-50]
MPNMKNTGTGDIPLKFAIRLTQIVNESYESGEMLEKVTAVTKDLLRYWFNPAFTETRPYNFHVGQRQAILNIIYVHEILKAKNVFNMYEMVDDELLAELGVAEVSAEKYNCPKYAVKMATGTGKTWVMHALMIWQYLNAKHEDMPSDLYSKNFLLVAPGLIVYERLLDAYLGKENEDGIRNFETSDFYKFQQLLIPDAYKNALFAFIQNNVVKKEEIGKKITGDGMVAITNWHLLAGGDEESEDENDDPFANPAAIIKDLLPITPGTTAGHTLESLDNRYFSGSEIEYLSNLKDIVVFNDEAHHIHENKVDGEDIEVKWQQSLLKIAEHKGDQYTQVDFSATPYNETGGGKNRTKHYFPHIVVDFDLKTAIRKGLVKTIVLDKRNQIASQDLAELDFRAERNGNTVIGLSQGQKVMLRAGLQKLQILEQQFLEYADKKKYPKMLVMCENTQVSPFVVDYLKNYEGLAENDILQIDSDKKGNIPPDEWNEIKQKLFNIDALSKPKVIVSVLMLREGFDVNNICVIVPLRANSASILLEQTVGRGLRLMWREPDYQDIKEENRIRLLKEKKSPTNYFDILSIVEHPAFMDFYNDLIDDGSVIEVDEMKNDKKSIVGDIIDVPLKSDYKGYDLFFPIIIKDKEETIVSGKLSLDKMESYHTFSFDTLKKFTSQKDDTFYSEEITVKTRFGNYIVSAQVFDAKSYNDFIAKIIGAISTSIERVGIRKKESFPFMQINTAELAGVIDTYIRTKLFGKLFNPFEDNNWRVLLLRKSLIVEHVIKEVSKAIYEMQNNIEVKDAVILKKYFSEIGSMKMRENYSIPVAKSIYERLPYPSNKGEYERAFMEYCDNDSQTESLIKIKENYHTFAYLNYIRDDGMISHYFPDFMVKLGDKIYLVETKAQKDANNVNVRSKEKSALDWIRKINELKPEDRMNCKWEYVLVSDSLFYQFKNNGASISEILEYAKLTQNTTDNGQIAFFNEGAE